MDSPIRSFKMAQFEDDADYTLGRSDLGIEENAPLPDRFAVETKGGSTLYYYLAEVSSWGTHVYTNARPGSIVLQIVD